MAQAAADHPSKSMSETKSFAQLQRESAALQREADKARQWEIADVIGRTKEAIKTY
jgi:hypothetical protein